MSGIAALEGILIAVVVLVFVVVRQLSARRVNAMGLWLVPVGLTVVGLREPLALDATGLGLLLVSLATGVVGGLWRATTLRVWADDQGRAWLQGTGTTLLLWAALFAVKIGLYTLEQRAGIRAEVGSASLLLPLAATLAAQNAVIWYRTQVRDPAPARAGAGRATSRMS